MNAKTVELSEKTELFLCILKNCNHDTNRMNTVAF